MNKCVKREISLLQYILTISGVQVGFGVLTLPREVAQGASTDGWISIIIGWALTTLVSLCIVQIMAKHPGDTLLDVLTRYLGKWLGKLGDDSLDSIFSARSCFLGFFSLIGGSYLDFT